MEFGDCDTGFGAHTAPSHGSSPIGLPTKLLRSNKSAELAAEASENSTNPQRISGVSLILPRIRCHVRALEELRVGAWGLGCSVLRAEDVPMELEERTQQRGRCVAVDVAHFDLGFLHGRRVASSSGRIRPSLRSAQSDGWFFDITPSAW